MEIKRFRRPSIEFALALMGGILVFRQGWPPPVSALAVTAVAVLLIALSALPLKARPLLALFAVAGFLALHRADAAFDASDHISRFLPAKKAVLSGTVRTPIDYFPHGYRFGLAAEKLDGRPVSGLVQVSVYKGDAPPPLPGDQVELSDVGVKPVIGFRNFDGFDYERFMKDRGVAGRANLRRVEDMRVKQAASHWRAETFCEILRRDIHGFILKEFPENERASASAMTVGITGGLDKQLRRNYAVAGIAHLLAVSGLHVGFISAIAYLLFHYASFYALYLLRRRWTEAGIHRKVAAFLCIIAVFVFVLTAGASVSSQRAGIMAAVFFLSMVAGREGELLNSLALSAIVVLLLDPAALFSASFILSYLAVLAIALLFMREKEEPEGAADKLAALEKPTVFKRIKRSAIETVKISLAVSAITAPALMAIFNETQGGGILTNLIAIPLAAFAVPSVFIAAALGWVWLPLGETLGWFSSFAFWGINFAARFFGSSSLFTFAGPAPAAWLVCLFYCVYALWVVRHRLFPVSAALLCVAIAFFYWPQDRQYTELRFIDVGQGDATLVMLKDGTNILVDGGVRFGNFDAGELAVLPELRRLGIRKLDAVIATHGDMDHVGGLSAVMKGVRVLRYMDNGEPHRALDVLRKIADSRGISCFVLHGGRNLPLSRNAVLSVLHPSSQFIQEYPDSKNNNLSLMLMLQTEGKRILLPADNEKQAEKYLLAEGANLKADVLKVAHHGSGGSTTPDFLEAVSPRVAIISVGRMNAYHMPAKRTMATLGEHPIDVYQTKEQGEVSLTLRDGKFFVKTYTEPDGERDY